ncbi:MAG TPA: DUF1579 domain-containing protein [Candidatus Polarisedimenticolaceae bacterium]|nr:DUF1579 domain-containing protein [Candidatus Polarisedimenticolaceae bacterium]
MDETMAAWMQYAQPGEHHRFLRKLAGSWETRAKLWMQPGAPPVESSGSTVNELIMGGRFLRSDYSATFMDRPFQGMGLDGFDNQKRRYVGLWIDTMGTMMLTFEGEADPDGATRTMFADFVDAVTGKPSKMKGVTTIVSDDEHRYESWVEGAEGETFKTMEIVFTRR